MEEQLNTAPCGYLVIDPANCIIEMNETLKNLIGATEPLTHMHDLLTVASRVYFQTYFTPSINTHGKVDEMYLTLKSATGRIPVLMNAAERNGRYECVLLAMTVRQEYENELLQAKRQAEKINQETAEAYDRLQELMKEVEGKKREVEKLNIQLQGLTVTDPLTGLKNRRYLDDKLLHLIEESSKTGSPLAVLVVDIDHFKHVNDTYGHLTGDVVLQELAWKLQAELTEQDIAARMGGEEFVIVLPNTDKIDAWHKAEQIRETVERGSWKHVKITISIGVAVYEAGDDSSSLFAKADRALYHSKNSGRNLVTASWQ
ncbi:GGDEF domain-containing protein [Planococcus sp. N028]|uniref:GGDEF domain-containing protein n=1 Tax=Planococcus shixiaomingii TaxID=3058393 RepID=A0ABT8N2K1_9BACL|nr:MULTISPECIES: GGDEF domain-containing protein [unclassified Planococcus (in: firmicutes)]MDN7242114.1 GGDEF domain-containing protein [Planococcus sp. N028]WKA54388.1 GGDEF domain-containing protein [Planococcus sp. N022]